MLNLFYSSLLFPILVFNYMDLSLSSDKVPCESQNIELRKGNNVAYKVNVQNPYKFKLNQECTSEITVESWKDNKRFKGFNVDLDTTFMVNFKISYYSMFVDTIKGSREVDFMFLYTVEADECENIELNLVFIEDKCTLVKESYSIIQSNCNDIVVNYTQISNMVRKLFDNETAFERYEYTLKNSIKELLLREGKSISYK